MNSSANLSSSSLGFGSKSISFSSDVRCVFESEVFEGFVCLVDTNVAQTVEEVLIFAVSSLYGILETNNFTKLLHFAKLRNFKINLCDGSSGIPPFTPSKGISKIVISDNLPSLPK